MTTFAFVALCLILFAIAGSFAVLWLLNRAQVRIDAKIRDIDTALMRNAIKITQIEDELRSVRAEIKKVGDSLTVLENRKPGDDKPLTATMPNQFQKMEKRYAEKFGNTLVVNGVETPAG